jgi:hypothetical protein
MQGLTTFCADSVVGAMNDMRPINYGALIGPMRANSPSSRRITWTQPKSARLPLRRAVFGRGVIYCLFKSLNSNWFTLSMHNEILCLQLKI